MKWQTVAGLRAGGKPVSTFRDPLMAHFNVTSRRVLDGFERSAAWRTRRHFGRALFGKPSEPIRPPRTRLFLGFREPAVDVGVSRFGSGPVLVFLLRRRIDHAGNVTGARHDEPDRTT